MSRRAWVLLVGAAFAVHTGAASRVPAAPASGFAMMVFAALLGFHAVAHLGLAVVARAYMPGLVTALLINLPLSAMLLLHARREGWVSRAAFWAVIPVGLVLHGPVLAAFLRMNIALLR